MANLRICWKNFFDEVVLTATPAMSTTMPETFAQLTARDKSARSTSAADQTIKGVWASNRKLDSFFVFNHNGQGGSVRLRLYANSDWTGSSYDSGTVPLFTAITSNSFDWGVTQSSPDSANDLLGIDSPYYLFFTTFTARSFQIDFTSCDRSYWDIGRIYLGKYLEAPYNPSAMTISYLNNDIQSRTKGASLRSRRGSKWRDIKFDMLYATDADRALWTDLISYIQMSSDVAFSLFPDSGGRKERDHVFNAQLKEPTAFSWINAPGIRNASYSFTEI